MGQHTDQGTNLSLFWFLQRRQYWKYGDFTPHTWHHVAFVFQNSTLQRYIYLTGVLDIRATAFGPLQATSGPFTVGAARVGGRVPTLDSYFTGYIDHATISGHPKSACEIYLTANLACYFTFVSASSAVDAGPMLIYQD